MSDEKNNEKNDEIKKEDIDSFDFETFARMSNAVNKNSPEFLMAMGFYNNPVWRNQILKELTSTPEKFSRDKVVKLLEDPVENQKALKDLAQYLMNTSGHFKRLVNYFGSILDFRYILTPLQVEKSKSFIRSHQKAIEWTHKFNIKYEFGNIMKTLILEDTGFYYLRESKNKITLQRMPTDYCMIVDQTDLGYQYAFDMAYFMRPGVTLEAFAPEFQEFYQEFLDGDVSVPFFWKDMPPEKGFVFKWDENFAGIIPVLIGLYLDTLEIAEFKDLLKSKTVLENWKILFQKIPMKEDQNATKNQFLIDPETAGKFQALIKEQLPAGSSIITSPMNIESVDFENSENRNDIVGTAERSFWNSAGSSPLLFGAHSDSSAGLDYSVKVDESFVTHMYQQFARFINFQMNRVTGKFTWEIDFRDSTRFNRKEQYEEGLQTAQVGGSVQLLNHGLGLKPGQHENLLALDMILGVKDNMIPLQSSHTMSTDKGGRPEKPESDLSASGVKTRDNEGNKNRIK